MRLVDTEAGRYAIEYSFAKSKIFASSADLSIAVPAPTVCSRTYEASIINSRTYEARLSKYYQFQPYMQYVRIIQEEGNQFLHHVTKYDGATVGEPCKKVSGLTCNGTFLLIEGFNFNDRVPTKPGKRLQLPRCN